MPPVTPKTPLEIIESSLNRAHLTVSVAKHSINLQTLLDDIKLKAPDYSQDPGALYIVTTLEVVIEKNASKTHGLWYPFVQDSSSAQLVEFLLNKIAQLKKTPEVTLETKDAEKALEEINERLLAGTTQLEKWESGAAPTGDQVIAGPDFVKKSAREYIRQRLQRIDLSLEAHKRFLQASGAQEELSEPITAIETLQIQLLAAEEARAQVEHGADSLINNPQIHSDNAAAEMAKQKTLADISSLRESVSTLQNGLAEYKKTWRYKIHNWFAKKFPSFFKSRDTRVENIAEKVASLNEHSSTASIKEAAQVLKELNFITEHAKPKEESAQQPSVEESVKEKVKAPDTSAGA